MESIGLHDSGCHSMYTCCTAPCIHATQSMHVWCYACMTHGPVYAWHGPMYTCYTVYACMTHGPVYAWHGPMYTCYTVYACMTHGPVYAWHGPTYICYTVYAVYACMDRWWHMVLSRYYKRLRLDALYIRVRNWDWSEFWGAGCRVSGKCLTDANTLHMRAV